MGCTRTEIVRQAEKWIGCRESNGSHRKIIDMYNSHTPRARGYKLKYTDAWCAGFASACAIACDATDIIPSEVGCDRMIELFKKKGIWVETDSYKPLKGDFIFYDWEDSGRGDNRGGANHVGIVQKVVDGIIHVIEGNYGDAVKVRKIPVNGRYIRGYGIPKYEKEKETSSTTAKKKTVTEIAREVIDGEWGNGDVRKNKLESAGYDYDKIQKKVNELLKKSAKPSKTVTQIAKEIINGKCSDSRWTTWGTGKTRKERLEKAGYSYASVQRKINELLK